MAGVYLAAGLLAGCAALPPPDPEVELTPVRRVDDGAVTDTRGDPFDRFTAGMERDLARHDWDAGAEAILKVPGAYAERLPGWVEPRGHLFPPVWLYAYAKRMQQAGSYVKAAKWYFIARERHLLHLRRCVDETAFEQYRWAASELVDLRGELARHPEITGYAARHAFAWLDKAPPTDNGLLAACLKGTQGLARARDARLTPAGSGAAPKTYVLTLPPADPKKWVRPAAAVSGLKPWAREQVQAEVDKLLNKPKTPPPARTLVPLR